MPFRPIHSYDSDDIRLNDSPTFFSSEDKQVIKHAVL
jgi:hypothetical protein